MKWIPHWLSRNTPQTRGYPALPEDIAEQLHQWKALLPPNLRSQHFVSRYIIVNTEITDFNLDNSRLLSVAAIAIQGGELSPAASYYALLADAPEKALADLLTFCGKAPLVVFSDINRTMLTQSVRTRLNIDLTACDLPWIDLYPLLPALFPERLDRCAYLRDWMSVFKMETFLRHHSLGDAWIIAQLFLAAQGKAQRQGLNTVEALIEFERHTHKQIRHI